MTVKNDAEFRQFQLDHVVQNKTRRVKLGVHTQALTSHLSKDLRGFRGTKGQGSHALRTIIRPTAEGVKADADMLVIVEYESPHCETYVADIEKALKESGEYRNRITVKNLCVTVDCGERSKLEVDLVACVESGGRFYVCPRDGSGFRETDGTGYRDWFNSQNEITGGNLKRVVRLLKYVRDHRKRFDCPSIVLTTLAAAMILPGDRGGESVSTQADALTTVLERMSTKLDETAQPPIIRNPALPSEEFDPRWTDDEYSRFKNVVRQMAKDARKALEETDEKKSIAEWRKVCGEKFGGGKGGSGAGAAISSGGAAIPLARRREARPFG